MHSKNPETLLSSPELNNIIRSTPFSDALSGTRIIWLPRELSDLELLSPEARTAYLDTLTELGDSIKLHLDDLTGCLDDFDRLFGQKSDELDRILQYFVVEHTSYSYSNMSSWGRIKTAPDGPRREISVVGARTSSLEYAAGELRKKQQVIGYLKERIKSAPKSPSRPPLPDEFTDGNVWTLQHGDEVIYLSKSDAWVRGFVIRSQPLDGNIASTKSSSMLMVEGTHVLNPSNRKWTPLERSLGTTLEERPRSLMVRFGTLGFYQSHYSLIAEDEKLFLDDQRSYCLDTIRRILGTN